MLPGKKTHGKQRFWVAKEDLFPHLSLCLCPLAQLLLKYFGGSCTCNLLCRRLRQEDCYESQASLITVSHKLGWEGGDQKPSVLVHYMPTLISTIGQWELDF